MKLTRRKLATLLTATAAAASSAAQAAPQAATTPALSDDATAARAALKANLETLTNTRIPIAVEPAAHFKA